MTDLSKLRENMVENQIAARGVRSERGPDAMRKVPREAFLPKRLREFAYEDLPLPIAAGQTISQPYIVALMTEALDFEGGERVLEIGTGSGYAAAILAQIAGEVYTVERIDQLAEKAASTLRVSATATFMSFMATGPWVGKRRRRTTQSSSRRAGLTFRNRSSSN